MGPIASQSNLEMDSNRKFTQRVVQPLISRKRGSIAKPCSVIIFVEKSSLYN